MHWQAVGGFGALVELSRNHEITGVGRHSGETRLWEGDSQFDMTSARFGWALTF